MGFRSFTSIYRGKYADPKNDFVFKKLFGRDENKALLINFINDALPGRHVEDVELIPTILEPEIRVKKQSIVDVLCKDQDGSKYIVEMQVAKEKGFEKRAVFYASKAFVTQMNRGGKYTNLKDVIFIAITNYVMFPEQKECISIHRIGDKYTDENALQNILSFVFIELPKYDSRNFEDKSGIYRWCDFFKYAKEQKCLPSVDETIKKAYQTLEMSSWSAEELAAYDTNLKAELDNEAREDQVRDEGINEGINIGIDKNKRQIALKLLLKNTPVEEVADITGLNVEEVRQLKNQ
jgi:predicted transposase/invertase (TIGR01784 family)